MNSLPTYYPYAVLVTFRPSNKLDSKHTVKEFWPARFTPGALDVPGYPVMAGDGPYGSLAAAMYELARIAEAQDDT